MGYFLKEHRRQKLISDLIEGHCTQWQAEMVANFAEGEHDIHLRAHALACIKGAEDGGKQGAVFIVMSAICILAIQDEAVERNMSEADFPMAQPIMDAYVAKQEASRQATRH